jgi:hypothetical protein
MRRTSSASTLVSGDAAPDAPARELDALAIVEEYVSGLGGGFIAANVPASLAARYVPTRH